MTTHYQAWADVPPNMFLTQTQLGQLDLPRKPGPVRATVAGRDGTGRKMTIGLHLITESTPTTSTPKQLTAARNSSNRRTCTGCGAHPDQPCTVYQDGPVLCWACAHVRALRLLQCEAANLRANAARLAAELLADTRLAVVHVTLTDRGTTPAGTRRPPSAAHLIALDATGATLADVTVRLIGPRSKDVPAGAVAPEDAAAPLLAALDGRVLLTWSGESIGPIAESVHRVGIPSPFPSGYGRHHDLREIVQRWRGDIDPITRAWRPPVSPGRADRMLYLLQQIAADHQDAAEPALADAANI